MWAELIRVSETIEALKRDSQRNYGEIVEITPLFEPEARQQQLSQERTCAYAARGQAMKDAM